MSGWRGRHDGYAYQDEQRAAAYARLGYAGRYQLAFRDRPRLIDENGGGRRALGFGCGAGYSTRFLWSLGFEPVGIDASAAMLEQARRADPEGQYLRIEDDASTDWPDGPFELALAAFPFDNIPGEAHRIEMLSAIRSRLSRKGRFVLIANAPDAPELYTRESASLSSAPHRAENAKRTRGNVVRVVITEGGDARPVKDRLWRDEDYRAAFEVAGLAVLRLHRPRGRTGEPFEWKSELEASPWLVYLCAPGRPSAPYDRLCRPIASWGW